MTVNLRLRVVFSVGLLTQFAWLSGCGSSANQDAVDACRAEVESRIEGKMGELDDKDMLANSKAQEDGSIEVSSSVVFRRGTDQQTEQTFNCTVAMDDAGRHTRVIRMQINW